MSSIIAATDEVVHVIAPERPRRKPSGEAGQGLAEYALILALIAIVAIVALLFLGGQISTIISEIGESI
jgi:Flp pilus assembly pilin Flp